MGLVRSSTRIKVPEQHWTDGDDTRVSQREFVKGLQRGHSLLAFRTRERKSLDALEDKRLALLDETPNAKGWGAILKCWWWVQDQSKFPRTSRANSKPRQTKVAGLVLAEDLARRADLKGSDVKLTSGKLLTPKIWPRRGVCAAPWRYKLVAAWKWRQPQYITELEVRAAAIGLKSKLLKRTSRGKRHVVLVDNQAAIGVISKSRSRSKRLNRLARHLTSYLLFRQASVLTGYVSTDENPADQGSRL